MEAFVRSRKGRKSSPQVQGWGKRRCPFPGWCRPTAVWLGGEQFWTCLHPLSQPVAAGAPRSCPGLCLNCAGVSFAFFKPSWVFPWEAGAAGEAAFQTVKVGATSESGGKLTPSFDALGHQGLFLTSSICPDPEQPLGTLSFCFVLLSVWALISRQGCPPVELLFEWPRTSHPAVVPRATLVF